MPKTKRLATLADGGNSAGWLSGLALVLGLLVIVSYLPVLEAEFVWDDVIFVDEPVVHDWSGLWNIWFSPADIKKEGHYWPVVYTSFWLEHKLWGLNPLGYHAVNLLLHIANVLLSLLARRLHQFLAGWGLNPLGYHAVNLLLHIASC